MFPNDATAEKWFAGQRWADGVHCPHCGSVNVQSGANHKTMSFDAVRGNALSGSAFAPEHLCSAPISAIKPGQFPSTS